MLKILRYIGDEKICKERQLYKVEAFVLSSSPSVVKVNKSRI
jgi:hypothetical protein